MSIVPAKWGTETLNYNKSEFGSKLSIVPAKFSSSSETIETRAASAKWTMSDKAPDCESNDPNDCRYWCYKAIPAQFNTVTTTTLVSDAMVNTVPGCNQAGGSNPDCGKGTYTKKIIVTPATSRVVDIPAVTKTIKRTVMVTPPTTTTIDVPAVTKTVKKTVMVTPPTTTVIDIPAVTKTIKRTVMVTPPTTVVTDIPEVTKTIKKTVMVTPPTTRVIDIPEVTKTFKKTVMVTPPTTRVIDIPSVSKTMKRTIMVTPPTTVVREIPSVSKSFKVANISAESTTVVAIPGVTKTFKRTVMTTPPQAIARTVDQKMATLKRTVLANDARVETTDIAAKYKTVTKEVLVKKGGLTTWEEVNCELVEYSPLPIVWNLGSATLTSTAKGLIDTRLMPVLNQGVAVEIASHTDSRGSASSNQNLSERRAQAVVNYLMAKGVNSSKLVAKGYGENRLTNRCSDGVTCTEREHQANRRTEFRVINQ